MEEAYLPIKSFIDENGRLTELPAKHKKKITALFYLGAQLAQRLEPSREYSEKEINELLDEMTDIGDPATLRRELYNLRFIDRKRDGSAYWLELIQPDVRQLAEL